MPRIELDQIPEDKRITVADAVRVLGWSESYVFRGLTEDGPGLKWAQAPSPKNKGPRQIKIVDARSLPPDAAARLDTERLAGPERGRTPAQLLLLDVSLAGINRHDYLAKMLGGVTLIQNGASRKTGGLKTPFVKQVAKDLGCHESTLYRKVHCYEEHGIKGLVPKKPGPKPQGTGSKAWGDPHNAWMKAYITLQYRAGMSAVRAHKNLLTEIESRQVHSPKEYSVPSYHQVKVFLRELDSIEEIAREKGTPGLKVAAGYCDREITERAGDCWCIDEWKVDGHLFLDWKISEVVRPWVLTIMDRRSRFILGWKIVLALESSSVLDLVEETLRRFWLPACFYSDRAGHFRGKMGRHYREVPKQEVLGPTAGALERLGVLHQGPRRKNPRANPIERSVHGFYASKALETLGGSSCGCDEKQAEALGVYTRVEDHRRFCTSGNALEETRLISFRQFEAIFPAWVEEHNRTLSTANGLRGLAPESAFKSFAPPQAEIEARRVGEVRLALAFAERFLRTVRAGGRVHLPEEKGVRFNYYSPLLTLLEGEAFECLRLRHDDSFIVVQTEPEPIIADRVRPVGIGDTEGIERAEHERARVEQFLLARYAPQPRVVKAPPIDPAREISSVEWEMGQRRRVPTTSEEIARRALAIETEAIPEEAPAPSLYDYTGCIGEGS